MKYEEGEKDKMNSKEDQEVEILDKTLEDKAFEVDAVLTEDEVIEARQAVKAVFVDPSIKKN